MITDLIPLMLAYPVAGALIAALPGTPARVQRIWMATGAVPALLLGLGLSTGMSQPADSLVFGGGLGLQSEAARTFLLFTAGLWTLAGFFAWPYSCGMSRLRDYTVFTLLSCAGNLGLFLASDVGFFYSSFAVMTFAAAGLVLHERSPESVRAGIVYVAMAVVGEVLILAGLLWLAFEAGTIEIAGLSAGYANGGASNGVIALLLFGFGVKAGLLPVHVWLPQAHPVAPTPASAVLSGAMVKAGLFGWLTFLPGGLADFPEWGSLCIILGLVAAFGAAYAGLTQTNAKATLAYSSISQLGLMTLILGIGLASAQAWPVAVALIAFFALNHAFAKGALFMSAGAAHAAQGLAVRALVAIGSLLAALVIAGYPLTGGSLATAALKAFGELAPEPFSDYLGGALMASSFATTVLLARFVQLNTGTMQTPHRPERPSATNAAVIGVWALALAAALAVPWLALEGHGGPVDVLSLDLKLLLGAVPILAGAIVAVLVLPWVAFLPAVPAGDLGLPLLRAGVALWRAWVKHSPAIMESSSFDMEQGLRHLFPPEDGSPRWLDRADGRTRSLSTSGIIVLLVMVALHLSLQ